jgi:putative transposase
VRALEGRGLSRVRACAIVGQPRRTLYYRRKPKPHDTVLMERTKELAQERQRFGWRRLIIMVRRDLVGVGESRFRRIYRDLGLQVHPRKKRKVRYVRGNTIAAVARPDERWSIDFMHDRLATGRTIRTMNVVDDYTRECLAIDVAFSFGSHDVIRCFEAIAGDRPFPQAIRFDNGPEFTSRAMLQWAATKSIDLQFIQPASPPRTLRSSRSTAASATSCLTPTRSSTSKTLVNGRSAGDRTTTRSARILRSAIEPRRSSPEPFQSSHPHSYELC